MRVSLSFSSISLEARGASRASTEMFDLAQQSSGSFNNKAKISNFVVAFVKSFLSELSSRELETQQRACVSLWVIKDT